MNSSLTGITTSGTPHLGNYVGAIKPAIKLSKKFKSYLFLADYHSLIKRYIKGIFPNIPKTGFPEVDD